MIIDVTGIELTPENCGRDCLGNGTHYDSNNNLIECCCDECDYMMCCMENHDFSECESCIYTYCPRKKQC